MSRVVLVRPVQTAFAHCPKSIFSQKTERGLSANSPKRKINKTKKRQAFPQREPVSFLL